MTPPASAMGAGWSNCERILQPWMPFIELNPGVPQPFIGFRTFLPARRLR